MSEFFCFCHFYLLFFSDFSLVRLVYQVKNKIEMFNWKLDYIIIFQVIYSSHENVLFHNFIAINMYFTSSNFFNGFTLIVLINFNNPCTYISFV